MAYERELEVALAAAREAAEILRRHYEGGTQSWEKSKAMYKMTITIF
jgi:hypothetical protein